MKEQRPITLGLSDNPEIKEIQQKFLELLKLYNDLKCESDVAHKDISNNIKSMMDDIKHAHQDSHRKDHEFKELQTFMTKFKALEINDRLKSLHNKIEDNEKQILLKQRTMTLVYLGCTAAMGITAVIVPIILKFL